VLDGVGLIFVGCYIGSLHKKTLKINALQESFNQFEDVITQLCRNIYK